MNLPEEVPTALCVISPKEGGRPAFGQRKFKELSSPHAKILSHSLLKRTVSIPPKNGHQSGSITARSTCKEPFLAKVSATQCNGNLITHYSDMAAKAVRLVKSQKQRELLRNIYGVSNTTKAKVLVPDLRGLVVKQNLHRTLKSPSNIAGRTKKHQEENTSAYFQHFKSMADSTLATNTSLKHTFLLKEKTENPVPLIKQQLKKVKEKMKRVLAKCKEREELLLKENQKLKKENDLLKKQLTTAIHNI